MLFSGLWFFCGVFSVFKLLFKILIALLCIGFIATLSLKPDILARFKQEGLKAFLPKSVPSLPALFPQTSDTHPNKPPRKLLYRWQDDKGQWHYTDAPPADVTSIEKFNAPAPKQNVLSFEGVRAQARTQEHTTPSTQNRVHIVGEGSSGQKPSTLKDSPTLQGIKDIKKHQSEQQKILDQL